MKHWFEMIGEMFHRGFKMGTPDIQLICATLIICVMIWAVVKIVG